MSVTLRVISNCLSHPLFNKRLIGLQGIVSNSHILQLTDIHRTSQRDLHQVCLRQHLGIGSTPLSVSHSSSTVVSTHRISRLFSSQTNSEQLGQLVYTGRVGKMLKMLKIFSLSTSAIGLSVQPYLLITFQNMSLAAAVPLFGVLNIFVLLNPFLIHFVAKKYVTELYFNPDTKVFTAYILTFFAKKQSLTFVAADVDVPDVPNMFAMLNVKGRPVFVHESDFTSIEVYKHLMGFDRPLNLTFSDEDKKDPPRLHDDKREQL